MTREEAIRELKTDYCGNRIICELYPDQCNREDCEIWLAIKALETQPDGDAISRQSAVDIVYEIDTFQAGWRTNAMDQIKALPSAQPEVAKDTNVGDMINRQAAIDALRMDISIIPFAKAREYVREAIETIYNRLEDLPSAQSEIIRCLDCKHFMKWRSEESAKKFGQVYECECGRLNDPKPYDFCSRPKRKENR